MTNQAEREFPEIPYFPEIVGYESYPWQRCFYDELVGGRIREAVDIPTGLGKTLCVLLLLLARLRNQALPTRVVYVVDRRAIVDQTAAAIRTWIDRIASLSALSREFHACAAFPGESPIGLGVLRGGLADDGGWRVDPARPTVIVGTVDMVGSRILFSGYGDGRSRRPMHAGLLGHDAVVMLDEAHLSPAMGELLRAVSRLQNRPEFRATTLSATSVATGTPLRLSRKDRETAAVRCRLFARKAARFRPVARRADRVPTICKVAAAHQTGAIAVFVQSVVDAERIATRLTRELGTDGAVRVALLTGTLRGEERSALAEGMVWQRFQPGSDRNEASPSVYLESTAAGEVGVDLDADHAVMDLGPLDSMIQRVGRVNRAGSGDATVTIVYEESEGQPLDGSPKTFRDKLRAARQRTLEELRSLPDLSPNTLCDLDDSTLEACTARCRRPTRRGAASCSSGRRSTTANALSAGGRFRIRGCVFDHPACVLRMCRHGQARRLRLRGLRWNRKARRPACPSSHRLVSAGSPSPLRPGSDPRPEAHTHHPDSAPPTGPTARIRRMMSAWEGFFVHRAVVAAWAVHTTPRSRRSVLRAAHARIGPPRSVAGGRLNFSHRAAGGSCVGPDADPV